MTVVVVHSERHAHHLVDRGLWVGMSVPTEEVPERVSVILDAMHRSSREVVGPGGHDDSILESVHDRDLLAYMRNAHERWVEWGYPDDPGQADVVGYAFPTAAFLNGMPLVEPKSPGALAGVYAMDTMTPIGAGTWDAARAAVDVAQTAAEIVAAGRPAYALCRPPGHHAGTRYFGGSCYLNNAAVAAATLRRLGTTTVGVVDVDAHHGNGTQEIFYERGDVVYASVHVDPAAGWFPHFVGFSSETGRGPGDGANLNIPLPPGSGDERWMAGVDDALGFVEQHGCEALVVSLGVDAAALDPESPLEVSVSGYGEAGQSIAALGLPTVFVQEGGYHLETLGGLVDAALRGFESEWRD